MPPKELVTYLFSLTREVVGRLQGTSDARLDRRVAAVVGRQDGVLEASRVLNVDIELAVLALLGNGNTGADGRNVGVEDEGDDAAVGRDLGAHGSLGASGSAIGNTSDLDLWSISHNGLRLQIEERTWPAGGASPSS